jgi:heme A synthase
MGNNIFWNYAHKYGAILGAVMGVSKLFEAYLMCYSDISLDMASIIYVVELIAIFVAYVWMLHSFTKKYSYQLDPRLGFKFTTGLGYILSMNILAAIIIGALITIFYSIMGYDGYVNGYIMRIDEVEAFMEEHGAMNAELKENLENMRDQIQTMQQPSMLLSISAYVYSYIFNGLIVGSIVALTTRRKPVFYDNTTYEQ